MSWTHRSLGSRSLRMAEAKKHLDPSSWAPGFQELGLDSQSAPRHSGEKPFSLPYSPFQLPKRSLNCHSLTPRTPADLSPSPLSLTGDTGMQGPGPPVIPSQIQESGPPGSFLTSWSPGPSKTWFCVHKPPLMLRGPVPCSPSPSKANRRPHSSED